MREMKWTAAGDFNIARCHCPPLNMTAARHIMNCIRQKQQLDALALFIDFAAAHTKPTPTAPSRFSRNTSAQSDNFHIGSASGGSATCYSLILFVELALKTLSFDFKDICLFLDRSHFYQSCVHKAGLFSNRRVTLNM